MLFLFSLPSNLCHHLLPVVHSSCWHRIVYRWFLIVYQISYVLGIVGYIVLLFVFTGVAFLLPINPDWVLEVAVTLVFYGVYFGVMGRDCAEVCVDYMAASMTVSTRAPPTHSRTPWLLG